MTESSDPRHRLETELSGLSPRKLDDALMDRIEAELTATAATARPSRWPDRFLLTALCSGALAACLIVAVMLNNAWGVDRPSAGPSPTVASIRTPGNLFEWSWALAHNDARQMDLLD